MSKLKMIFICVGLIAVPMHVLAEETLLSRSLQKISQEVEYVFGDYAGSVDNKGTIVNEDEYKEQVVFLRDAVQRAQTVTLPGSSQESLRIALQQMLQAVENRKPPAEVQLLGRSVRQLLLDTGVRWEPPVGLDQEQAKRAFQANCSSCHGATGHADTPAALALTPRPVDFHDAKRMDELSPLRAYHNVTFGVSGTAMPSFDFLPAAERWNLALYVVGLRHQTTVLPAAELPQIQAWAQPWSSLAATSQQSDEELKKEIAKQFPSPVQQAQILAYLRTRVPYETAAALQPPAMLAAFRHVLRTGMLLTKENKPSQAKDEAIAGYFAYFEPLEPMLKGNDAREVVEVERLLTQHLYRLLDEHPVRIAQVEAVLVQLDQALGRLEQKSAVQAPAKQNAWDWVLFASVFGITLREGLETALLVAFLIAFLRKQGHGQHVGWVHAGWIVALLMGGWTYVLVAGTLSGAGKRGEQVELVSTLLTLLLLVPMTHLVIGSREVQNWLGFLKKRLTNATASAHKRTYPLVLLGVTLFAAYREMLEMALMYQGAWSKHHAPGAGWAFLCGVLLAVVCIVGLVVFVIRTGKRLNPRPLFLLTSIALGVFCIMLADQLVHAAQLLGYIHATPIWSKESLNSSLLSWSKTWQSMIAQLGVALVVFGPSLVRWYKQRNASKKTDV